MKNIIRRLFGSSLQEVSYTDVLEQFKKMNKQL